MSAHSAAPRRILIVNPNTSAAITQMMVAEARRLAPQGVEICGATAPFGSSSLECPAELAIAAHAVLTVLAEERGYDAAIIGAFGDPGLSAAADLLDVPVFGLGRAGLEAASCQGQRRFALITVGPHLRASLQQAAQDAQVDPVLTGLTFLPARVLELARDPAAFRDGMLAAARACVTTQGAEAVLFAGAPFAGIGRLLSADLPVPVFDGLTSAVERALTVPARARTGADAPQPLEKDMVGLSAELKRLITRRLSAS